MNAATGAVTVGLCVAGVALSVLAPPAPSIRRRLDAVERRQVASKRRPTPLAAQLSHALDGLLLGSRVERSIARTLVRAGIRLRPHEFVLVQLAAAIAAAVLATAAGGGLTLATALVVAVSVAPYAVFRRRTRRRVAAFDAQLPELLGMLASALRAGHGFEQALRGVVDDAGRPAQQELERALAEVRLGRALDAALADVAERLSSPDLELLVTVLRVQRQTGGGLAELLAFLAETVRARQQFRRRVRALTAMGRASANLLSLLPFAAAGLLTLVDRSYVRPLWATSTGRLLVAVAALMLLVGTAALRRIVTIRGVS